MSGASLPERAYLSRRAPRALRRAPKCAEGRVVRSASRFIATFHCTAPARCGAFATERRIEPATKMDGCGRDSGIKAAPFAVQSRAKLGYILRYFISLAGAVYL